MVSSALARVQFAGMESGPLTVATRNRPSAISASSICRYEAWRISSGVGEGHRTSGAHERWIHQWPRVGSYRVHRGRAPTAVWSARRWEQAWCEDAVSSLPKTQGRDHRRSSIEIWHCAATSRSRWELRVEFGGVCATVAKSLRRAAATASSLASPHMAACQVTSRRI